MESRTQLAQLVRGMTAGEFLSVCEERALTGACGWPLCATVLPPPQPPPRRRRLTATGGGGGSGGGDGADRGGGGSVDRSVRRGKYRIDAKVGPDPVSPLRRHTYTHHRHRCHPPLSPTTRVVGRPRPFARERKVYLRSDIEMFCCAEHRGEAESVGTSLELFKETGESSGAGAGGRGGGGGGGEAGAGAGMGAKAGAGGGAPSELELAGARRAAAVGDVNANVKRDVIEKNVKPTTMDVIEKYSPGRSPGRPPSAPTYHTDTAAADMVEAGPVGRTHTAHHATSCTACEPPFIALYDAASVMGYSSRECYFI